MGQSVFEKFAGIPKFAPPVKKVFPPAANLRDRLLKGPLEQTPDVVNIFSRLQAKKASVFEQFDGIKEAGSQQRKAQRRAEKKNPKPSPAPRTYAKPMPPHPKRNAAPASFELPKKPPPVPPAAAMPPPTLRPPPMAEMPLPNAATVEDVAQAAAQHAPPPGLLRRALLPAALLAGTAGLGYGLYRNHRDAEPVAV